MGKWTNMWKYNLSKGHSSTNKFTYNHLAIFHEKLVKKHNQICLDHNHKKGEIKSIYAETVMQTLEELKKK